MPTDRRKRRRHAARTPYDHGEPLRRISLVPFAGILGIAAALIATTYGIPPHAVMVDLSPPSPADNIGPLTPNADRLVVTETGAILWNGQPVDERELGRILVAPHRIESGATLRFSPDGRAPYARVLQVMEILRRHGAIDRCFRLDDIARYRQYERPDTFDDLPPPEWVDCLPYPM